MGSVFVSSPAAAAGEAGESESAGERLSTEEGETLDVSESETEGETEGDTETEAEANTDAKAVSACVSLCERVFVISQAFALSVFPACPGSGLSCAQNQDAGLLAAAIFSALLCACSRGKACPNG